MNSFNTFKTAVDIRLKTMTSSEVYRTDVTKDELWNTYLASFKPGTDPIYKERTEHDCQCCKQFIRACGSVVSIINNEKVSAWDISVGGIYQPVADALAKLVKSKDIVAPFLHYEQNLGTDFNHQLSDFGKTIKYEHFHFKLPLNFVKRKDTIATLVSKARSTNDVFYRALSEISVEAVETTLELIEQNSIYRGEEHKFVVTEFLKHQGIFNALPSDEQKLNYVWAISAKVGAVSSIRNSAIGTLITDISDGTPLDDSVRMFESKVAPTNYKRPKALITKSMIASAQKTVKKLGIENSLDRRYAVTDDITINNVLFADRSAKKAMNVFDEMESEVAVNPKKFSKIEKLGIAKFMDTVLPKADSVEIMFDNKHVNNLVSLIAPETKSSKNILKWGNNFSWTYNGEVTDSIKERVKNAGGRVNGVLRCSVAWFNKDDLDIHVKEPDGNEIFYANKKSASSGTLDVDMNAGGAQSRSAVENIVWTNQSRMKTGVYELFIRQFTQRETIDTGFVMEVEFGGITHTFSYANLVGGDVAVAKFEYSKEGGIKFLKSLPSTSASKEVWNVSTQKFHKVRMVMNSPNHWDEQTVGNKHWFFILEDCKNDEKARGFFNEFLKEDLTAHRKVFEVLGSKMKVQKSDNQLSGLGFSSTQKTSFVCRVTGAFARTIEVKL